MESKFNKECLRIGNILRTSNSIYRVRHICRQTSTFVDSFLDVSTTCRQASYLYIGEIPRKYTKDVDKDVYHKENQSDQMLC